MASKPRPAQLVWLASASAHVVHDTGGAYMGDLSHTTIGAGWTCQCGMFVPYGCSHSCGHVGRRNDAVPDFSMVIQSLQAALLAANQRAEAAERRNPTPPEMLAAFDETETALEAATERASALERERDEAVALLRELACDPINDGQCQYCRGARVHLCDDPGPAGEPQCPDFCERNGDLLHDDDCALAAFLARLDSTEANDG